MPYSDVLQSLPATLRQQLRQPTWLPTVASLGLHGLMLLVLPVLPLASSNAEEPAIIDPVSVLELTPGERDRLPDFSTSDQLLPAIPPGANLYPPALSNPYSTGLNQPPFSTFPLNPRPFSFITPTPLPSVQSRFPNPRNRSILPVPGAPRIVLPNPTTVPPSAPSPEPTTPPQGTPGGTPTTPNSPDLSGTPQPSGEPNPVNPNSTPSPNAGTGQLADRLAQQRQLEALLRPYGEEGTTESDGGSRYSEWLISQQEAGSWQPTENPDDEGETTPVPQGMAISTTFPKAACQIRNLDRTEVWFGIMVSSQGEIVGEPDQVRGSGYLIFDQAAQKLIPQTYDVAGVALGAATESDIPYLIKVKFARQAGCTPINLPETS